MGIRGLVASVHHDGHCLCGEIEAQSIHNRLWMSVDSGCLVHPLSTTRPEVFQLSTFPIRRCVGPSSSAIVESPRKRKDAGSRTALLSLIPLYLTVCASVPIRYFPRPTSVGRKGRSWHSNKAYSPSPDMSAQIRCHSTGRACLMQARSVWPAPATISTIVRSNGVTCRPHGLR